MIVNGYKTISRQLVRTFSNKMDLKNVQANGLNKNEQFKLTNGHSKKCQTSIINCTDTMAVSVAVQQLHESNVIALPTDTVYGLACNANDPLAIQKLYNIKGRQETNPVAICVANIKNLKHWGEANHLPNDLLNQLLPGAVTIVLGKSKYLDNPYLNKGVPTIGIRIPDFDFIREVSRCCEFPIALTSANRSGDKSTLSIDEFMGLWPELGAVFDGGQIGQTEEQRAASTIVNLSKPGFYQIKRIGVVAKQTIDAVEQFNIQLDTDDN